MKKGILIAIAILLLLFAVYKVAFEWGKDAGKSTFIQHYEIVKDIAELGALEVDGVAKYKVTNKEEATTWSALINNIAFEKTVALDIPYIAKFGIDLNKDTFNITNREKSITVRLPEPILLSLEMKLDKVGNMQKSGLLVAEDSELYLKAQKELYLKTRTELEQSADKKERAKASLRKIFTKYFAPAGKEVVVVFGNEKDLKPIAD
jgi:hypothetical protein